MEMREIHVHRLTWTVQTCRRVQADFCLLSCMVGDEY